jgi:2-C-methyl-D-erythritol 4-phosphate cytidylyltransferase
MIAPRYFALVPAAGVGARMGVSHPKQYLQIAGKPMLAHVLHTFAVCESIAHTFVVVSPGDGYIANALPDDPQARQRITVVFEGGATRHQSVLNGLNAIRNLVVEEDWILVHDAARPGLTVGMVAHLIGSLQDDEVGGLLAMPVVDTLKRADDGGRAQATVPRSGLWAAQTPQMFRYALLRRALSEIDDVTDEASAVEALGLKPKLVEGSARNFKVTLPQDAALAEFFLKGKP